MPRIYSSCNDPLDFCQKCFPKEEGADEEFGNTEKTGEGPDGRGNCYTYDADHPSYEEVWDYSCYECGKLLTEEDD